MNDYHQRFRERFKNTNPALWNWMPSAVKVDDILAFIDEIVAEERGQAKASGRLFGYEAGRKDERAALIEKIEEIRKNFQHPDNSEDYYRGVRDGADEALDDLLTHLRCPDQDGCAENPLNLPPLQTGAAFVGGFPEELLAGNSPQEETGCGCVCHKEDWEYPGCCPCHRTECCEKCVRSNFNQGIKAWCIEPSCLCHKPRTEETEKEGASFSGREEAEKLNKHGQKWCLLPTCDKLAGHDGYYCEDHHSKYYFGNTATPQSREQGGEKCGWASCQNPKDGLAWCREHKSPLGFM